MRTAMRSQIDWLRLVVWLSFIALRLAFWAGVVFYAMAWYWD